MTWENTGALGGTRTPNLLIRSQMLYPLSYERRLNPAQCTAPPRGGRESRLRRLSDLSKIDLSQPDISIKHPHRGCDAEDMLSLGLGPACARACRTQLAA